MLSGGISFSRLARQSGGERQQHLQRGLVQLLATYFASHRDIAIVAERPSPSPRHKATVLVGRRPAEGRRWAFTEAARRRLSIQGAQ